MSNNNNSNSSNNFITGVVIGSLVGAATALFLAPKSGKELRSEICEQVDQLKGRSDGWKETVMEKGTVAKEKTIQLGQTAVDKGSQIAETVKERANQLQSTAKEAANGFLKNKNEERASDETAVSAIQDETTEVTEPVETQADEVEE